jgi:rSAM/selenodomain-associated transferase 2/rSAM/selenodomain-associated transferase 1
MYAGSQPEPIRTACRMPSGGRLILFGRYPVPGRTKTRLIPSIGPVGAADLQRRYTQKSLTTALQTGLPASSVAFCYTGGTAAQVKQWLGHSGIGFSRQVGDNLGNRMRNALQAALDRGDRPVVLVGTDIPAMTAEHLETAFRALNRHDLVLGPSRDGGYWLIGMNRPVNLFQGIPWGRPDVLARTLEQARRQGLTVARLEPLNDIDTEADLAAWQPDGRWRKPYLTVVIPTLDEAGTIAAAIGRLRTPDCQIIVADGGSRDNTVKLARSAGAAVIVAPRGRALQQNSAARQASGRVLLFVHADTTLPRDYVPHVFEALMPSGVAAGAFQFKTDYDHWSMRLIEKTVRIRSTLFQMPYGDQALFMTKNIFKRIGGFPHVPIAEDLYLVKRLARLGRIAQARAEAVTSARRWRTLGVWRTTLINYIIAAGCLSGISPGYLAPLYRLWLNQKQG